MFTGTLHYLSAFLGLKVPDLDAAADWYGSAFGFVVIDRGADEERPWLHMRRSEGQDIVLILADTASAGAKPGATLHLATEQSVWSLSDRARGVGGQLMEPSGAEADIAGVATIRDPYGYEWVFFRRSTPTPGPPGASWVERQQERDLS